MRPTKRYRKSEKREQAFEKIEEAKSCDKKKIA